MKKKLGPLELWQWLAIGAAIGLGTYLYRRTHPATQAAVSPLPASAQFNPIDPTTGMPVAGGVSTGADTSGGQSLSDLLSNFQALEGLLAGLQEIVPPGPATETDNSTVQAQTGSKPSSAKQPKKPAGGGGESLLQRARDRVAEGRGGAATVRELEAAGYSRGQINHSLSHHVQLGNPKNPGHKVTTHKGGRKSPSSTAPHNPRQHKNVAPPAHQRHPPTKHPSARRRHR